MRLNRATAEKRQTRSGSRGRWLTLWVFAAAMIPVLTGAQSRTDPMAALVKSVFHSVAENHWLLLTVGEVGSVASASEVTIEFRDSADQRRAFTSGVLLRNQQVRLRASVPAGGGQLRAIVMITPLTGSDGSEPVISLEDLDANTIRIETKPPCAPPSVGSGGGEGSCDGGWRVSRMTLEQAGRLPD